MQTKNINIKFIRHGTTLYNEENRVQGGSDIPLSVKGLDEINNIDLNKINYDVYYHSSLMRSKDTLFGILNKYNVNLNKITIQEEDLIIERKYGIFEGLTKNEIKIKFPKLYNEWLINENIKGENIESIENVILRIKLFIRKILNSKYNSILAVTHSGYLYALYKYITDKSLHLKPQDINVKFPNCCTIDLNILHSDIETKLILKINDQSFIKKLDSKSISVN